MDPLSIISAGTAIAGGIGRIVGANKDRDLARQTAERNVELQREFAQNGIQWRVQDAEKAGIHPVYALGANTMSFSPVSVGSNLSEAFGGAGQDISRAIMATQNAGERNSEFTKMAQALQLKKMGLENELLASKLAQMNAAPNPPMPVGERYLIDGQGQTAAGGGQTPSAARSNELVNTEAMKRQAVDPSYPHLEAGAVGDVGFTRTRTGWAPVYTKDAKDRLEDDVLGMLAWNIRNRLAPSASINMSPPSIPLKRDEYWYYHPGLQEYRIGRRGQWREPVSGLD